MRDKILVAIANFILRGTSKRYQRTLNGVNLLGMQEADRRLEEE